MLHVVMWKWHQVGVREGYTAEHVNLMTGMLRYALGKTPYRAVCVTDERGGIDCETFPLWDDCNNLANASRRDLPSCYRRLRLYDPETQREMGIHKGDRVLSIDLDTLLTGDIQAIVARQDRFLGWGMRGPVHPLVFNGSFQMFWAGDLSELWTTFDPHTSPKEANKAGYFGSDQSWLSYKLVGKEGCTGLDYPLVASYPNNVRQLALLDKRTRIIFFHGRRKPWHQAALAESPWIKRYWRN